MEKVCWKTTYGFKDFISDDEHRQLLKLVEFNEPFFGKNGNKKILGYPKFSDDLKFFVDSLRNRIIELENIVDENDENFSKFVPPPFIGIYGQNSNCLTHKDLIHDSKFSHVRYNLIFSRAEIGGLNLHDSELFDVEEKTIFKCNSSIVEHGSTVVLSEKPRGVLSIGFLTQTSP